MNQDETIALFERCEAARAQAKKTALAEGKPDTEACAIARDAAKAIWNGWAERILAERKALEANRHGMAEKDAWMATAKVDFNRCHFLIGQTQLAPTPFRKQSPPDGIPVKAIHVASDVIDFSGYIFPGDALFVSATFSDTATFDEATFFRDARFESAKFSRDARFDGATFSSNALFVRATISGNAWFNGATFSGAASFVSVTFSVDALFVSAMFSVDAMFNSTTFSGSAYFLKATFRQKADFVLSKFDRFASFDAVRFHGPANFNAIRSQRSFSMAEARFEQVPDFIQAHFEEAPRLDNVVVVARMVVPPLEQPSEDSENPFTLRERLWRDWERRWSYPRRRWQVAKPRIFNADDNIPAKWRNLRRLAIQAHDQDREHRFFAGEIRSARFATDRPLPWPIWKGAAWASSARFVFGYCYQWFSNFGRSVIRPFLWWSAALVAFALVYMCQHHAWVGDTDYRIYDGIFAPVRPIVRFYDEWRADRPCFTHPAYQGLGNVSVGGLSDQLRAKTTAPNEALHLAFRNAFLVLDGGEEAAHRIYGCLYGLELYNSGDPVPIVPPGVSIASAFQKLFSAVMIFLFGLALRNMLKMK